MTSIEAARARVEQAKAARLQAEQEKQAKRQADKAARAAKMEQYGVTWTIRNERG